MRKTALMTLTAAAVLSFAPAAYAQTSPSDTGSCEVIDAYTKTCPTTEGTIVETSAPPTEIPTVVEGTKTVRGGGATLPMTGAELSGLVLAGVVLVGGGTTLVVATRRRKQHPAD